VLITNIQGFKNISTRRRIINSCQTNKEENLESKFIGKNFLFFDNRLGEKNY
jgi:UPF0176 protein